MAGLYVIVLFTTASLNLFMLCFFFWRGGGREVFSWLKCKLAIPIIAVREGGRGGLVVHFVYNL